MPAVAHADTALALRERMTSGALRVPDLANALVAHIEANEPDISAWAWFDPDFVRAQAEALEKHRTEGRAVGRLHGVPVGIKDIIDTKRIPTENGCALDKGRVPKDDAFVVSRLKQHGALIMGKTVTTELAFMDPASTRNPHNLEHTPGGSSSGSAAAVAAGMVPVAIGTQTGGSVIRPASYCGVVGYKPTFGLIPRTGILSEAASLDTVGVFSRSVEDAAMLAEVLMGHDPGDRATSDLPVPNLLETCVTEVPVKPEFAFIKTAAWDAADEDTIGGFEELVEQLGGQCAEIELPAQFGDALRARGTVHVAEMAKAYYSYASKGFDQLGPELQKAIEAGNQTPARDYISALDWPKVLDGALVEIFGRFDAILTPAATGAAPRGLGSTGNPAFNGLWTFLGTPAISLPLLTASNGMPMGVQLVGQRGNDARLLRTARWLFKHLGGPEEGE